MRENAGQYTCGASGVHRGPRLDNAMSRRGATATAHLAHFEERGCHLVEADEHLQLGLQLVALCDTPEGMPASPQAADECRGHEDEQRKRTEDDAKSADDGPPALRAALAPRRRLYKVMARLHAHATLRAACALRAIPLRV